MILRRFICCLLFGILCNTSTAQKNIISLNQGWTIHRLDSAFMMSAKVPGCVQNDLIEQGVIPHPYLANDSEKADWVAEKDWTYQRQLVISKNLLNQAHIDLVFEGLDTFAEVFVNNVSVLKANNMFRKWSVDVKPFLHIGNNHLKVVFKSVVKEGLAFAQQSHIRYPADNEIGAVKMSPFIRKAPFQFGWDFAPKLLTIGIIKPVYLHAWSGAKINNIRVQLNSLNKQKASYKVALDINCVREGLYDLCVIDKQTQQVLQEETIHLKSQDKQSPTLYFDLKNPKLWWSNGLGKAHLYTLAFVLRQKGAICDQKTLKIGVRELEVIHQPDSIGESFYVKINGKPLYIKGSNFVPTNSLIDGEEKQRLTSLFDAMQQSHYNMVRIWGGGMYGSDDFYNLADEKGILVWQDFMFACTMYPSDADFLSNVAQEAKEQIERIRNHPSLALWCGNNEIAVGWQNWGWQKTYQYSPTDSAMLSKGYDKLFKKCLPEMVDSLDKGRFYFHSSPVSNWGKAEDFKKGDNHYWGVYHGEEPFEAYQNHIPRFNSEFGFQSFPSWQSLQYISKGEKPTIEGAILTKRQKSYKGNKLLQKYMDWYYQKPTSDEEFVYLSQLQQAEGMKMAIESNRSAMPYNMGALVWQQNDCWPAISWSTIAHNGQWKAAQYFIKKAYQPVIVVTKHEKDSLLIQVVSDKNQNFEAVLSLEKRNLLSSKSEVKIIPIHVKANAVSSLKLDLKALNISDFKRDYLHLSLQENNKLVCQSTHYFTAIKNLDLKPSNIAVKYAQKGAETQLILRGKTLAKNVFLSIENDDQAHFSDNYFDMLPDKEYHINIKTKLTIEEVKKRLKIKQIGRFD